MIDQIKGTTTTRTSAPTGWADQYSGALRSPRTSRASSRSRSSPAATSNNTIVVNDTDSTIYIGGVARAVTPWQGRVVLDNKTNSRSRSRPEHYVITIVAGNHARIEIADTGGGLGRRRSRRLRHEPARQRRARTRRAAATSASGSSRRTSSRTPSITLPPGRARRDLPPRRQRHRARRTTPPSPP